MAAAPQHVTGTYLLPALQHYAHLLAPSQRARSVKAGSIKTLLEVQLPCCLTFAQGVGINLTILIALPPPYTNMPAANLRAQIASAAAFCHAI